VFLSLKYTLTMNNLPLGVFMKYGVLKPRLSMSSIQGNNLLRGFLFSAGIAAEVLRKLTFWT
jgi:hypothetical protein